MAWIPERHASGYAHFSPGTYPGHLVPSQADNVWTDEQFPAELFGLPGVLRQQSKYNGVDRPAGPSIEAHEVVPQPEGIENMPLNLRGKIDTAEKSKRIARENDHELLPSRCHQRTPPTPPRSNNSFDQLLLPLQLQTVVGETMSPRHPVVVLDLPKSVNPTAFLSPSHGPGPGPGPGPLLRETSSKQSFSRPKFETSSVQEEWQRIRRLRVSIWSLRDEIQNSRKALRQKQVQRSIADDRYFQHARSHSLGVKLGNRDSSQEQKFIMELLEECQRTRDEYGPMEDDCNTLEDQLQRDEFKLTQLEIAYDKRQSKPEAAQLQATSVVSDTSNNSSYSESEDGEDLHPLVYQYLYKLGEANNLQDCLDEQRVERSELLDRQEALQLVEMELEIDDQERLNGFDKMEDKLRNDILDARVETDRLKQLCFEQGLVDEKGNPTDFEKQERTTFSSEAPDLDAGLERSEFVKFPVLLPGPGSTEVQLFRNNAPRAVDMSNNAGDHINQWLLHQLRSSPLYVNLLARTFDAEIARSGLTKNEEWQFDVLAFWYKDDGATKEAATYRIYSSGTATHAPLHSSFSYRSYTHGSDQVTIGIATRSASLSSTEASKLGSGSESPNSAGSMGLLQGYGPKPPPLDYVHKLSKSI
jgi:hypothetical protein